jgi:hypothetical protein
VQVSLVFNMPQAPAAATLPVLVAGVARASAESGCAMRQPPAPSDSTRSTAPEPGTTETGEAGPTTTRSLPAAASLRISASARPETLVVALIESRVEALAPALENESRDLRGDMGNSRRKRPSRQTRLARKAVAVQQRSSYFMNRQTHRQ